MLKKFTDVINEKKYPFGCLMVDLSFFETSWVNDVLSKINTEDIYNNESGNLGLEFQPHCTVLYGLHSNEFNDSDMEEFCRYWRKGFTLDLRNITIFENDEFDVVKFDINSESLQEMNKAVSEQFPFTSNYPKYHPHCTIAYVKKGTGNKYVQTLETAIKASVTNFVYSKPEGIKIKM